MHRHLTRPLRAPALALLAAAAVFGAHSTATAQAATHRSGEATAQIAQPVSIFSLQAQEMGGTEPGQAEPVQGDPAIGGSTEPVDNDNSFGDDGPF